MMDYDEIISAYKSKSLDISDLKKKLETARPLNSRPNEVDFRTTGITFNTIMEGINAQMIVEKPERVQEYLYRVDYILEPYFENIVSRINRTKAWGMMGEAPSKITVEDFRELSTEQKLKLVINLNQKFTEYLKTQQYADLRNVLIADDDLSEDNIQRMQFIMSMFNALRTDNIKNDFFCISKKLLQTLISYKKSKFRRLDDYFSSKHKYLKQEYDNYSNYYSTEDFRDIAENLVLTSAALKVPTSRVIDYYEAVSRVTFEIRGLEDELDVFKSLQEKTTRMVQIAPKEPSKKPVVKEEPKAKEIKAESQLEEPKTTSTEVPRKRNIVLRKEGLSKEEGSTGKIEEELNENNGRVTVKEQIYPLILAWFGREDQPFNSFIGPRQLSKFFDKIKQIQDETGIRVGLFIVTNANKEVTSNRIQELMQKATAKGLPDLVEGALGGYSSFRIDIDGTVTDLSQMSEETRNKITELLGNTIYSNMFQEDIIDPREDNYLRYVFSIKKNPHIDFKYLSFIIASLLKDQQIKKQPLSFVPFIEGDISGVDVLLRTQLEGINRLSDFIKSKYYVAPGKTLKANISSINKFMEQEEQK